MHSPTLPIATVVGTAVAGAALISVGVAGAAGLAVPVTDIASDRIAGRRAVAPVIVGRYGHRAGPVSTGDVVGRGRGPVADHRRTHQRQVADDLVTALLRVQIRRRPVPLIITTGTSPHATGGTADRSGAGR